MHIIIIIIKEKQTRKEGKHEKKELLKPVEKRKNKIRQYLLEPSQNRENHLTPFFLFL